MLNEFRFAFRSLRRSLSVSTVIVITMALGIGANTAIFSVVDALLFKPLPYPNAERLYAVVFASGDPRGSHYWPYPKYAGFAAQQTMFESTAAYAQTPVTIDVGDVPQRVQAEVVTSSYFPLLGIPAAAGRVFVESENEVPARDAVVLLSDGLWRGAFGAHPDVIGRAIEIKQRRYTVVGILPPGFAGQTGTAEIWLPVMMADHFMYKGAASEANAWWMRVVAALRPDVTESNARAGLPALSASIAGPVDARMPSAGRRGGEPIDIVPFRSIKVDPTVSRSFIMLLAATGVVLIIACANTANLLLGRALSRRREFAVRRALGASVRDITRQVGAEILLLAVAAASAGLLAASWILEWVSTVKLMNTTGFWSQYARTFDYFEVSLDARVITFGLLVALATALICLALPVHRASTMDLNDALKQGGGAIAGLGRHLNARAVLVLLEVTFSLILLVFAALMVRSSMNALSSEVGFDAGNVFTMTISPAGRKPIAFYRALFDGIGGTQAVRGVALAAGAPLSGGLSGSGITVEGRADPDDVFRADVNVVTPEFFQILRVRLIAGRLLSPIDTDGTVRAAVVSREFADAAWPGQDPIGRRFKHGFRVPSGDGWTTVVGVVNDVTYGALEDPREPMVYLSAWQPLGTPAAVAQPPNTVIVEVADRDAAVVASVRGQLQQLDHGAPVFEVMRMEERLARVTARYRYSAKLVAGIGLLGLFLTAVGLYAVIAHAVSMRSREIAVRVALGAARRHILRAVIGNLAVLTLAGSAAGLAVAFAGTRVLAHMLYGVTPHDRAAFAISPLLLILVGIIASYLPARRALRVDPVMALKSEA